MSSLLSHLQPSSVHRLDFIGDIHGYADELEAMLARLGYVNGVHPEGRRVVFLGDYIDRGPEIERVLQTVRSMVDLGTAYALMGNHELYALLYHTPNGRGDFLREHTEPHIRGHADSIAQLGDDLGGWLPWIAQLPLWIDFGTCRAVHACWSDAAIAALPSQSLLGIPLAEIAADPSHPVNLLLDGLVLPLPQGLYWHNAAGARRTSIRVKWWLKPENEPFVNVLQHPFPFPHPLEEPLTHEECALFPGSAGTPLFFGHYWLQSAHPALIAPNLCCLDYSVILPEGFLCAYRFDGEKTLCAEKFVSVPRRTLAGTPSMREAEEIKI